MSDRIYRFAEFELLSAEGELRTADSSVRLQEKPLRLLIVLLENPQRLVTREQLRERMWDSDTFVDFELGINVGVMKVRDALGDSAENPRFIQTVAKKGYRFLLPVAVTDPNGIPSAVSAPQTYTTPPVTTPGTPNPSPGSRPLLRWHWVFAAVGAGVLTVLGLWLFQTQLKPRPTQIHSLAVLPLRNLSPDSGQDYFADGITEELITDFAQSLPLRVISRTSVMRYKQSSEPIRQIARELGVEAIVEGAVARSGDRVTITVQLIDATEDRHLWAHKYEHNFEDVLALEAEVSREVAKQVGGKLSPQQDAKAAKARAVDPQVYELCLMGRFHWNRRTAADLAKSADYYQQAIARDPGYAPAYAGMASAYALMPSFDSVGRRDTFQKAEAAAQHALELDDSLAEAHATLALIRLNRTPGWMRTEPEFRRALELNPSYATAHHWYAFYLLLSGRHEEALTEMEEARKLDPLSAIINADEGDFLYCLHRDREARARLRQAIELAPDFGPPHAALALIEIAEGNKPDALKEARTALVLDPTNPGIMGYAGYVLAVTGETAEASRLLVTLKDLTHHGAALPHLTAFIQIGLGRRDEALNSLEEKSKTEAGVSGLPYWRVFDELKTDPRYQKLVAESRQN